MVGGIGKVKLQGTSDSRVGDAPADNHLIVGQNTMFTRQFRGYSSYAASGAILGKNPFKVGGARPCVGSLARVERDARTAASCIGSDRDFESEWFQT